MTVELIEPPKKVSFTKQYHKISNLTLIGIFTFIIIFIILLYKISNEVSDLKNKEKNLLIQLSSLNEKSYNNFLNSHESISKDIILDHSQNNFYDTEKISLLIQLVQLRNSLIISKNIQNLFIKNDTQDEHLQKKIKEINNLIEIYKLSNIGLKENFALFKKETEKIITFQKLISTGFSSKIAFYMSKICTFRNLKYHEDNSHSIEFYLAQIEQSIENNRLDLVMETLVEIENIENSINSLKNFKEIVQIHLLNEHMINYIINTEKH